MLTSYILPVAVFAIMFAVLLWIARGNPGLRLSPDRAADTTPTATPVVAPAMRAPESAPV